MGVVQMMSGVVSGCLGLVGVLEGSQVDGGEEDGMEGKMVNIGTVC